jgi:hypothetical protein
LAGFVARTQPSLGIHDRLAARALFLEGDGRRVLWLHADVIAFEREDVQTVKKRLFDRFGLHGHEVVISATHTHSGPTTARLLECGEYDASFVAGLVETLLSLSGEALRNAKPVSPVFAEGSCEVGSDRRGQPGAHADHRVPVLGFRRPDGSYAAVLAAYAVHCVAMGPENRLVSADILGHAARVLKQQMPGNPVVLFVNGAAGNINPPGVQDDFAVMEGWGGQVAAAALEALGRAKAVPDTIGTGRLATMLCAPGHLSDAEARATVAGSLGGNERFLKAQSRWFALLAGDDPRLEAPVDVQVVEIGGVRFVCFGAEVFSRMGEGLGDRAYPVGYANGDGGYLCPEYAYSEGGYEPEVACLFYGTNPIRRGAFESLRGLAKELIQTGGAV